MAVLRNDAAVLVNPDPDRVVRVGKIKIDVAGVSVRLGGQKTALPLREFQVLLLLADNAGRALSVASILSHVWHPGFVDTHGNLKVQVNRLRKRMKAAMGVDYIRTVRGVGYILEVPQPARGDTSTPPGSSEERAGDLARGASPDHPQDGRRGAGRLESAI